MRAKGRLDVTYEGGALGSFQVTLAAREGGFDAIFLRSRARAPSPEPARAPLAGVRPRYAAPVVPVPALHAPLRSTNAAKGPASTASLPFVRKREHAGIRISSGPREAPLLASYVASAPDSARAISTPRRRRSPRASGWTARCTDSTSPPGSTSRQLSLLATRERARLPPVGTRSTSGSEVAGGRARADPRVPIESEGLAAAVRLLPRAAPVAPRRFICRVPARGLRAELPHGLVLVCGATGSGWGKSTTPHAALAQEALRREIDRFVP